MVSWITDLNLETARATATTGALELASLGSDVGLDAVVGVGVVDAGAVAEVGKGSTAPTLPCPPTDP